jgi:hypothetical protein
MLHPYLVVLILAAAALVSSGCGSSAKTQAGNSQSATTQTSAVASLKPESRAEFISEANAICTRLASRRASNRGETNHEIALVAADLASFEKVVRAELERHVPPATLTGDWRRLLAYAQALAEDTAKIAGYAENNELSTATASAVVKDRRATEMAALAIARRDGIEACAKTI